MHPTLQIVRVPEVMQEPGAQLVQLPEVSQVTQFAGHIFLHVPINAYDPEQARQADFVQDAQLLGHVMQKSRS